MASVKRYGSAERAEHFLANAEGRIDLGDDTHTTEAAALVSIHEQLERIRGELEAIASRT